MRISDWISDVCSSDPLHGGLGSTALILGGQAPCALGVLDRDRDEVGLDLAGLVGCLQLVLAQHPVTVGALFCDRKEHPSELQSLMRSSSAVCCLKHNTTVIPSHHFLVSSFLSPYH